MLSVNNMCGFGAGTSGIEFVGGTVANKDGAASGNTTISLTSGLTGGIASSASSGDFVLGVFAVGGGTDKSPLIADAALTPYTEIADLYSNSTPDANLEVGYKFITDDTEVTFGPTGGTSDEGAMAVYVFRGVDTTTPLDVTTTTAVAGGADNPNPPSITPVTKGAWIVCAGSSPLGLDYTTPAELTNFQSDSFNGTNDQAVGIGIKTDWVSGAFDCGSFVSGFTTGAWCACSIALRPAS